MPNHRASDGTRLHYDVLGDASLVPIIVLAGGAARHPEYLGDLAGLSQRWRLVLPHLRGVGRSPAPDRPEQGSFWHQADDVEHLREHLGLDRCLVVGHSAGTRLAMSFGARFPHRLAGMLLITPPASHLVDVPADAEDVIAARAGEPAFDDAVRARRAGPDTTNDDTFNAWQDATAPLAYARWTASEQAHARVGRYDLGAARAFFSVEPPADLTDRLGEIAAPVQVVAGSQDAVAGVGPVVALADVFTDGRATVLDDCGHMPWVEQPTAFRRAVDPFLESCAAGSAPGR